MFNINSNKRILIMNISEFSNFYNYNFSFNNSQCNIHLTSFNNSEIKLKCVKLFLYLSINLDS